MRSILVIFVLVMSGNAWCEVKFTPWNATGKPSKLSQMKKHFDKRVIGNPLLKMKIERFTAIVNLTSGYCDRRARFDVVRCYISGKASSRKYNGYRMDDLRDPRVYTRFYRYTLAKIKRSPKWGHSAARSYGYQARYIP